MFFVGIRVFFYWLFIVVYFKESRLSIREAGCCHC